VSVTKHLIIGLDGFDWDIAQPMIAAELLPNLQKLLKQGSQGSLQTVLPKSQSATWATSLSGLWPDQHNILSEREPDAGGEGNSAVSHLSTSQSLLWDWLAPAKLKTQLLCCYLTSVPVETVDVCVGQHYPGEPQFGGQWSDMAAENMYGLNKHDLDYLGKLRLAPADVPIELLEPLINDIHQIDQDSDRRPAIIAEALARTISVHNVATWLMETRPADVLLVNYPLLSQVVGHFVAYQAPQHKDISPQDFQRYNAVIQGLYRFFDALLGRLMALAGTNARIMLLSHYTFEQNDNNSATGYGLKQFQPTEKTPIGHVIFSGAGLHNNAELIAPQQLDISPTLLASLGIAIPSTLIGRIWQEAFAQPLVSKEQQATLNKNKDWGALEGGLSQQDHIWLAELSAMGMVDPLAHNIKQQRMALERQRMLNKQQIQAVRGDVTGAIATMISWLGQQPQDVAVKLELITLLFFTDQHKALLPLAQNALAQLHSMGEDSCPSLNGALSITTRMKLLQAAIAFAEHKSDSALAHLQQIDFSSIQDASTQTFAGNCSLKLGSLAEAEVLFKRAMSINAGFGPAYSGLARCYYAQQQYEPAANIALRAVELQAGDFASHRILGLSFENLAELELAELHYRAFLQRYPNDSEINKRANRIKVKFAPSR